MFIFVITRANIVQLKLKMYLIMIKNMNSITLIMKIIYYQLK